MRRIKNLLLLALACLTCFSVGIFTACNGGNSSSYDSSSGDETPIEYLYKIRTQSEGGFGLKDVNVALYDGETQIANVNTNGDGNAFFTQNELSATGTYRIELSNVPKGWHVKDDTIVYQTTGVYGSNVNINFTASLITDEAIPSGKIYRVGDVMYDFTLEDCEGDTYTLSTLLEEKDMVLLNFWATYCGPCAAEFPVMNQAYQMYQSSVEILAISNFEPDTQATVDNYKGTRYTFPMVGMPDSKTVVSHFSLPGVPVSVIIDRYGVISWMHSGNMVALTDFTNLFDKFVGENYVQTVIVSNGSEEGGAEDIEFAKPDVSNPNIADVKTAFSGTATGFDYSWESADKYAWPWLIGEDNSGKYLAASNKQIEYSYAVLNVTFTASANTVLAFDYNLATELNADYLYVMLDGVIIHALSGLQNTWRTCNAYVFEEAHAGEHKLTLMFYKDASISADDDVFIRNLRFFDKADLDTNDLDLNILRHAATDWNNPADHVENTEKTTRYQNYVNVKLGEDGYYHVIPDNASTDYKVDLDTDPLLFADLMNSTRWNKYDIWQLAYNGLLSYQGIDLKGLVEEFAWACTNSTNGFVPVTPALRDLLKIITKQDTVIGEEKDNTDNASRVNYLDETCHVSTHENEWLELCLYYQHYGDTPQLSDPTRGITFDGAIEIFEGENEINCFASIVPVGIKHKFTPTQSGVYHFYSKVDKIHFDTAETYNPQMWLVDSDRLTFLAENADFLVHHTGNPENFDIKYYLEAGKTYYCLFAFFLNATGKFEMNIDYKGEYFEGLTNCAIGPYTMNMVTNEIYTPGAQNVKYDETNDVYRITDNNGVFLSELYDGLDDRLYWDLNNVTFMFPSQSLSSFLVDENDNPIYEKYDEDKRLFYLPDENGVKKDYSEYMADKLWESVWLQSKTELRGKIAVTKELMHIMVELAKKYDGFGGVTNSWQLMCYYYKPLGNKN